MKSSPIQLLETNFLKIHVEPRDMTDPSDDASSIDQMDVQFFDHVIHATDYWDEQVSKPGKDVEERTFHVTLGIRTVEGSKRGHYEFELIATGVVACFNKLPSGQSPQEAVKQYGLALLFGMLREQLASITARMTPGIRLLPTMSFVDSLTDEESKTHPSPVII